MTDPSAGVAGKMGRLGKLAERIATVEDRADALRCQRDELIAELRAAGVPPARIARAAKVTPARVSQLAPAPAAAEPGGTEPAAGARPVPAGPIVSGLASRREQTPRVRRVTAFADFDMMRLADTNGRVSPLAGRSLADVLGTIDGRVTRVYVTGDWAHWVARSGMTQADALRRWGMTPPAGWTSGGHFTDKGQPIFRHIDVAGLRQVEVTGSAGWFGDEMDAITCVEAWAELGDDLAGAFPGGVLMTTPSTTGRDLWARTIGPRQTFPTLSPAVRQLIAATSGQGRNEVIRQEPARIADGVTYLDGRFMYAALCHGLPVGEPSHRVPRPGALEAAEGDLHMRGRWRARVTVPAGWSHVGIIGRQSPTGWDYPAEPGTTWETWADAVELRLAVAQGWGVELIEGLVWHEGRPLTAWRDLLVGMWQAAAHNSDNDPVARCKRHALRSLVLFGIGGFAAGATTRESIHDDAATVPAGATVFPLPDGRMRAVEPVPGTPWTDAMAHPEWAATIWARARVALLDHALPDGSRGGALHIPREQVIGFRTDAIFLAGPAPKWADDGKPGRFRVKGTATGYRRWPTSNAELIELRKECEA